MKVLIAGGGTAGHINPGLAIARKLQKDMPDVEIMFVGTNKGLETKLIPREGFGLELIRVQGFRRKISKDTLKSIAYVFLGMHDAKKLVRNFKPDVVIGTGGYVCGPVLFVANLLKIPTIIHESNAIPGVTNKILSRFVDCVCVSFDDAKKYFSNAKRVVVTGNPLRDGIRRGCHVTKRERAKVTIFGGSRGAKTVNKTVVDMINKYGSEFDFDITFATGEAQYKDVVSGVLCKRDNINIVPYIYDMPSVMANSDLLITRAGAITLSEITAMGKASILIPSPYVTANHQEYNARALEKKGASVVILEKDLNQDVLYNEIKNIIGNRQKLDDMAKKAASMGILDASEKICNIIETIR